MCLPEKSKSKEIHVKKQQELLQVIEDTRRRMQAETLLAANNIFCVWPGICLTHSVADYSNNNNNVIANNNISANNNNNIIQRNNNNVQQRTRGRSHQRYFPGTTSRHRLQTISRRLNPIIYGQEVIESTSTSDENETTINNVESENNALEMELLEEPTHFEEIETVPVEANRRNNNLFSPFQPIQQFAQLPTPNYIQSEYPMMQISPENIPNSNQITINNNLAHSTDVMFGGVLPLLNIFQFFRNI